MAGPVRCSAARATAAGSREPRGPRLGLHRLRLAGRLTEIRDPDLRFSLEEARELLEASGIELPEEALVLLHERTEGWAAGLRLAVISLARHPDPERFVSEFSGSERTVAGYLMAEVLDRQPPEVRELLLRTSILDRVSGPLADSSPGARARSGSCRNSRTPMPSSARWTRPAPGFATTICSPTSCSSSCDAPIPRASIRCTARPPAGTNSTEIRWRRFVTPRRRRIGARRAPAHRQLHQPVLGWRRATVSGLLANFLRRPRRRIPSWRSRSRAPGCSTADRKR